MKLIYIALCITLFVSVNYLAYAQTSAIHGIITDTDTTNVISGVSVYLEGTKIGSLTNAKGEFALQNIPAGTYQLIISCIGYKKTVQPITLRNGELRELKLAMTESISLLPEVVVMAGGEAKTRRMPGAVNYVSPKELQKYHYTDIARVFRTVTGINIQEEDGFGLRPNIGLRGSGVERSSKITVMEDGILAAPAPYTAPAAYYFPTIGRMYAVEVLKGSSQIKYGPFTTGGAINLLSTPIPDTFSGRFRLLGGSFESYNMQAYIGNSHKNVGYIVEAFTYGSDGYKTLNKDLPTGFHKRDFLAKLRINTNPDARIYQELLFKMGHTSEVSNETYTGLTEFDFGNTPYLRYAGTQNDVMTTEQKQYAAIYSVRFTKHLNLKAVIYRNEFQRNWYKLNDVIDSTGKKLGIATLLENPNEHPEHMAILKGQTGFIKAALLVRANNRIYYAQGIQAVASFDFNLKKTHNHIEVGFRYHYDNADRFQWDDLYKMQDGNMLKTNEGVKGTESNRIEDAKALSGYLQYMLKINKFTITPGLRYESIKLTREDYGKKDPARTGTDMKTNENTVQVLIPGIGVDYAIRQFLLIFAGVHKGFAPPGSTPETKSESSINYELGGRFQKGAFSANITGFFNDYSNLLGAELAAAGGTGSGDLFNGGTAQTLGLELFAGYDILTGLKSSLQLPVSISYTFTDARFTNDFESAFEGWGGEVKAGDQLPYMANNQFTISLGFEGYKFGFNISGKYTDPMRTIPGQGSLIKQFSTDRSFMLDLSCKYNVTKFISFFVNGMNLLGKPFLVSRRPAGLRPAMPFTVNAGVVAQF